ncbi:hypothetical protein B0H10DRAFT_2211412 [Mycena sp. CBHHK59/15]|nr:hypothetical protein B0H10DRAFT_2211412 [Mycena sp. CBHHK59/15]
MRSAKPVAVSARGESLVVRYIAGTNGHADSAIGTAVTIRLRAQRVYSVHETILIVDPFVFDLISLPSLHLKLSISSGCSSFSARSTAPLLAASAADTGSTGAHLTVGSGAKCEARLYHSSSARGGVQKESKCGRLVSTIMTLTGLIVALGSKIWVKGTRHNKITHQTSERLACIFSFFFLGDAIVRKPSSTLMERVTSTVGDGTRWLEVAGIARQEVVISTFWKGIREASELIPDGRVADVHRKNEARLRRTLCYDHVVILYVSAIYATLVLPFPRGGGRGAGCLWSRELEPV